LIIVVLFVMLVSYSVADPNKMNRLKGTFHARAGQSEKAKGDNRGAGMTGNETAKDGALVNSAILSLRKAGEVAGLKDGDIAVERFLGGVKVRLNNDVVFAEGSASINKSVYPYLDEMGKVARERNLSLKVQGHTDDVPIRSGEFPTNWELSAARAANVMRYLISKQGFPAHRLTAEGFAQYRPVAPNSSSEGRRKNRRIEIVLGRERDEKPAKGDKK
jgi:chemotaxis protein MotB